MNSVLYGHSMGFLGFLVLLSQDAAATSAGSISLSLDDGQCEQTGASDLPASNLLQIATTPTKAEYQDSFGPGKCVKLDKGNTGTCWLRTRCEDKNISDTEFAFVCFNPDASMPHTLHSFGRGGFKKDETFDTNVHCKTCMSVDTAFLTGDSVVKNALAALPLSRLPSLSGAVTSSASYSANELAEFKPKEQAFFGPDSCISTFLAPSGTCLIRTKCADSQLSAFNVGVTCLDKSGGYSRYLFGKDTFKLEETFDTLIACQKCLGVGPQSSQFALHGLMPRRLVDDVGTLKTDMQTLNEKIRVLQQLHTMSPGAKHGGGGKHHGKHHKHDPMGPMPKAPPSPGPAKSQKSQVANEGDQMGPMPDAPDEEDPMGPMPKKPSHFVQTDPAVPTVMMSRRGSADATKDAGADTATMDVGPVQVVSHRRGATIAELLRRVSK